MAYIPTTWVTGDTVTATKLNKLEQGVANAGSAVICTSSWDGNSENYVLDKTAQEIYEALINGVPVYIKFQYGDLRTDYLSQCYLAPVIGMMNYAYTAAIRIIVSKAKRQNFNNDYYNYAPGVAVYSATSLNAYPIFLNGTSVNTNAMADSTISDLT